MTTRTNVRRRLIDGRKLVGYNVYEAPDGCAETYLGQVTSLRAARSLAARGGGLEESLYGTARAAGHCAGMSAPDKTGEVGEPVAWFGRDGWHCAVAVYA